MTGKKIYVKWQTSITILDFKYTEEYQLDKDDDTLIASGTNSKVRIPSSYQNYQDN